MTDAETIRLSGTVGLLRARNHAWARSIPVLGEGRSYDVGLVVSELSTNALKHGSGDEVLVRIGRDHDAVVVAIAAESEQLPVVPSEDIPHYQPAGRGLRVVSALVDSLSVSTEGRTVEVMCRFDPARSA